MAMDKNFIFCIFSNKASFNKYYTIIKGQVGQLYENNSKYTSLSRKVTGFRLWSACFQYNNYNNGKIVISIPQVWPPSNLTK